MLEAVIFDLGDTLISSERALEDARDRQFEAIREEGYELSREKYEELCEKTSEIYDKKYWGDENRHNPRNFMEVFFDVWDKEASEEEMERIGKAFIEGFVENMELIPGAHEVLKFCESKGLYLALISNGRKEYIMKLLSEFDLGDYFETVLPSSEYGEKSTLEPFKVFLGRTDFEPENCLMVGNRKDEDVHAKKLGMETVWIDRGREEVGKELEPDFRIENLEELKGIIETLL
ncbi:MAG: HAD family hydrolase [Candidatus Aenigmatarchaeota archaeon]